MSDALKSFWQRYTIDKEAGMLGEGRYGKVYRGVNNQSGEEVAIKQIFRVNWEVGLPYTMMREDTIFKKLRGVQNILRLYDAVCDHGKEDFEIYMVFELMSCSLKKYIRSEGRKISRKIIQSLMRQLINGTHEMHYRGIYHRDLKTDNILIDDRDPLDPILKIGDMGLGKTLSRLPIERLTKEVATLQYKSPEIILGSDRYGLSVDMWGIGCIFGELFTKKVLFGGNCEYSTLFKIFSSLGPPNEDIWPGCTKLKYWPVDLPVVEPGKFKKDFAYIGEPALDLLQKLLTYDPKERITAYEALQHPYFSQDLSGESDDKKQE